MLKKVVVPGLLGGLVLILWMFVVNGLLGLNRSVDMKPIPSECQVYEVLVENIVEPGRYVCNPELSPSGSFPGEAPVFGIFYSGMGHESAGGEMLFQLPLLLLAPMIGAWMLSVASDHILSSYPRKVLFVAAIGLLFAVFGDLMSVGIDGYPLSDALVLALHDIVLWTIVGLVVAWRIRPEPGTVMQPQTVRI